MASRLSMLPGSSIRARRSKQTHSCSLAHPRSALKFSPHRTHEQKSTKSARFTSTQVPPKSGSASSTVPCRFSSARIISLLRLLFVLTSRGSYPKLTRDPTFRAAPPFPAFSVALPAIVWEVRGLSRTFCSPPELRSRGTLERLYGRQKSAPLLLESASTLGNRSRIR